MKPVDINRDALPPVDWDIQPFGEVSDLKLAETLGVAEEAVRYQRKKRDIDPSRKPMDVDEGALARLLARYPDEQAAYEFFFSIRWPDGIACPRCEAKTIVDLRVKGRRQLWFCKACEKQFSLSTNHATESSKLPWQKWLLAYFLIAVGENVGAFPLSKRLGVSPKTGRLVAARVKVAPGPVETAEARVRAAVKRKIVVMSSIP